MSYRNDLSERLILIPFLLARRPHSRQELARRFGVDAKTVSSTVDSLTAHYPIVAERRGREVFFSLADGFNFQFPRLSVEELATLLLAQEAIRGVGITAQGSPYAGYADSLLENIKKSLPRSIVRRMEMLSTVYGSASFPAKDFARHAPVIDSLAGAALKQRRISAKYHSLNKDQKDERLLEPYAVYFDPDGATLKLVAFAPEHREIRVFSIDRIQTVKILEEKFARPKDFDLRRYLSENCFNGIHGAPVRVRLRATGVTARIFAERAFHPSQRVVGRKKPGGDGQCSESVTIEMNVAGGRGLARFVLSWLPDVEVLSPKELREEVQKILEESLHKNFCVSRD